MTLAAKLLLLQDFILWLAVFVNGIANIERILKRTIWDFVTNV